MNRARTEQWSKWRGLVTEQVASGQSVAVYCRERGVREWQLYEWKRRFRREEEAQFLAVELKRSEALVEAVPLVPSKAIEIRLPKRYSLMVEPGFDAMHLRALLSILEAEA
jgi:transposase-like protein